MDERRAEMNCATQPFFGNSGSHCNSGPSGLQSSKKKKFTKCLHRRIMSESDLESITDIECGTSYKWTSAVLKLNCATQPHSLETQDLIAIPGPSGLQSSKKKKFTKMPSSDESSSESDLESITDIECGEDRTIPTMMSDISRVDIFKFFFQ
ncbi:hypothetical protein FQR65_LT03334 [Abscondita terminalis]|nr:hypothetical protein FQR65_LT03334 [Abscondita terminalis]